MPPRGRTWEASYEAQMARQAQAIEAMESMRNRIPLGNSTPSGEEYRVMANEPVAYTYANAPSPPVYAYQPGQMQYYTVAATPQPYLVEPIIPEGYFFTDNGHLLPKVPKTNADYDSYYRARVPIPIPEVEKLCEERRQKDLERQQERLRQRAEMERSLEAWRRWRRELERALMPESQTGVSVFG